MPIINEGRITETLIQSERGARRQLGNKPALKSERGARGRKEETHKQKQEPRAAPGQMASALLCDLRGSYPVEAGEAEMGGTSCAHCVLSAEAPSEP